MLLELIKKLKIARKRELDARAERMIIELELDPLLSSPIEGSKTHTIGNDKIIVKRGVNRKVDWNLFIDLANELPRDLLPIKYRPELDNKKLEAIKDHDTALYHRLRDHIISTPKKTAITIRDLDND